MRLQSPESCEFGAVSTAAQRRTSAAGIFIAASLGLAGSISPAAAQGRSPDVAYVEAVSGRVLATTQGRPAVLDVLDTVGDRTRLVLPANTELRICHYQMRRLVTLKGPLQASISASGVTADNGRPVNASAETCAEPVVSSFQGGLVSRTIGIKTAKVPLQPSIKVVNQGSGTIRRIALRDGSNEAVLQYFDRTPARPVLETGRSYLLVIERGDGSELKLMLQPSAETRNGPLLLVVP